MLKEVSIMTLVFQNLEKLFIYHSTADIRKSSYHSFLANFISVG